MQFTTPFNFKIRCCFVMSVQTHAATVQQRTTQRPEPAAPSFCLATPLAERAATLASCKPNKSLDLRKSVVSGEFKYLGPPPPPLLLLLALPSPSPLLLLPEVAEVLSVSSIRRAPKPTTAPLVASRTGTMSRPRNTCHERKEVN